jgi:cell wall-associated NlpC family hydrolase
MSRHEHHKLSLAHHEAQVAVSKLNSVRQHTAFASHNVVLAAYMLRGTRYVMGGTSRSGFDCSGFVRYILGHAGGVSLPRTAVDQFYHGAQVSLANLEPGDLVFFKNTYKHGISHVGIYAGSGKFIHAANPSRGVQMDSLDSSYYRGHYAGARRVLPAQLRALAALP